MVVFFFVFSGGFMRLPEHIANINELEEVLSAPTPELVELMKRLDGDIMILGIAGKMGVSMGIQAKRAIELAGVRKKVFGVARFSDPGMRLKLETAGVETIVCDLMDLEAVRQLPQVKNIIFMAGRKFGTEGCEDLTWAMNVLVPGYVGEVFRNSRIVAFSTGCVYPLVGVETCGCTEDIMPAPVGEYSQSCLGRERIFQYCARQYGTKSLLFRLNYSNDLRYGVLHDIARSVWEERPVNNTVGFFNVIWQGDATVYALRSLELASAPCSVLNVTGPETASVEKTALMFGQLMNKKVQFSGETGNRCYLNNSAKMCALFGYPSVTIDQLIRWQAEWLINGGESINIPTHFEVNNGKF